jgi:hypothetical protein
MLQSAVSRQISAQGTRQAARNSLNTRSYSYGNAHHPGMRAPILIHFSSGNVVRIFALGIVLNRLE